MPPVIIGAVASTAMAGLGVAAGLVAIPAGLGLGGFLAGTFAVNLVVGGALFALQGKPKKPASADFRASAGGRTVSARGSVESRRVVYGEARIGGTVAVVAVTGTSNQFLHVVYLLCEGPVEEIGEVYLDDKLSTDSAFSGKLRIKKYLGRWSQDGDVDLFTDLASQGWTTEHRLHGIAYVYVRYEFDQTAFPNGLPNLSAVIRGRKVWDPRDAGVVISSSTYLTAGQLQVDTSSAHGLVVGDHVWIDGTGDPDVWGEYEVDTRPSATRFTIAATSDTLTGGGVGGTATKMLWNDCAALVVFHYLAADYGLRVAETEFDETTLTAAANLCDEYVTLTASTFNFTVGAVSDDTLSRTVSDAANPTPFRVFRGDRATLASTGTLPTGLSAGTTYYYVPVTSTTFRLATTRANSLAGTVIDVTGTGTGTHTLTRSAHARYTAHGVVNLEDRPADVAESLLSSMAGVVVHAEGLFRVYGGASATPTKDLGEDDLRAPIGRVRPYADRKELYNHVRGVYVDPHNHWLPTDFPPAANATYESNDGGERIERDLELPFTTDDVRAQRLAKLALEQSRQAITLEMKCKLTALDVAPWDVVRVTNSVLSWTNKHFRVRSVAFAPDGMGVDLVLQEHAAGSYEWAGGAATSRDLAANTELPDPFAPVAPTSLTLNSGTGELFVNKDGTVVTRLRASWVAALDVFRKFTLISWRNITTGEDYGPDVYLAVDKTEYIIDMVEEGEVYDVRIRSENVRGALSAYVTALNHTIVGKTAPPGDVTGFSAQQNGAVVTFQWTQVADADLAGYELRYMAQSATFSWDDATVITRITRGTLITNAGLPPGTWRAAIKARDTSKNYSTNARTYDVSVTNLNESVKTATEHPRWPGTLTNMVRHDVSGRLIPDSQTLASAMTDAQLWNQMVYNPFANCDYETAEVDLGADLEDVRVHVSQMEAAIGPGESGTADPLFSLDYYRTATGGGYDGYEPWTMGVIDARFFKGRVRIETATGVAYVSKLEMTADGETRTQSGKGLIVAVGGTAVTFPRRFITSPSVQVTLQAASGLIGTFTNKTAYGFTGHVYNTSGTDVGGTVDWTASGA